MPDRVTARSIWSWLLETSVEDGIHLAMPYDVHVIFGLSIPVGADNVCMHSTYTGG